MPYFLIWSQRFQLAINCIFLTNTFETGLLRNASQDDSIPITMPVIYYSNLVWHHFLHTSYYNLSTLCSKA